MAPTSSITHAELGELLATHQCGVSASDLHGSLTGFLCGGGSASPRGWLDALALECERGPIPPAQLESLYGECSAWLAEPDRPFEPLLPAPNDGDVAARADALVEWCRGFLGGLGLSGHADEGALSSEANEILQDFGNIAKSNFEYDDDEEDETALTEVVEFIRVGVLLLHAELTSAERANATVH